MGKKNLALMLSVIIAAITMFSIVVEASVFDSGTCGANLNWTMDYNGTLSVSGSGDMYNNYTNGTLTVGSHIPSWQLHKDIINNVTTDNDVTSIGNRAFYEYKAIENLSLGTNVKIIGSYAFYRCINIKSFKAPQNLVTISDNAFSGCTSLESIFLPSSVKRIDTRAFYECTSLNKIEIGTGLERIDAEAFAGCNNLTVYYAGSEEQWKNIYISSKNNNSILNAKIVFNYKIGKF